jgi:proline iminopeptidase
LILIFTALLFLTNAGLDDHTRLEASKIIRLAHLVSDMEQLRHHLKIPRWHLFGGSWGSTLSLAYAIEHPENCIGLILRSNFLDGTIRS